MTTFHSIKAVAKRLNLHDSTVWRYVQDGRLPAHKIGGFTWRITDEALQEFIKNSEYAA
jgi:excisionase family DNA binding protein